MNINLHKNSMLFRVNFLKCIISIFVILILILIPAKSFAQVIYDTIEFEGRTRDYIVFLPMDYANQDSLPLVLNLHGSYPGESGGHQMGYSQMNTVADTAGFIAVYPTGLNENGDNGFWYADLNDPMNGVGFIDALLDTLNDLYKVNNDQIYSCGFSDGGSISIKLSWLLHHRITAIASVGGGISDGVILNMELNRPMPFLSIHGTMDSYPSAEITLDFLMHLNICSSVPDTLFIPDTNQTDNSSVEKFTYTNRGTGCKIVHYKVINGGHTWPGAIANYGVTNRDISASAEIWNFFKHYKRSELSFLDHDITLWSIIYDLKTLPMFLNLKPTVLIQNGGLNDESEIPAAFKIDSSGTTVYEYSQAFDFMKSMEKKYCLFDKAYTLFADHYKFMCIGLLADDENVLNDTLKSKITVTNCIDDFESGDAKQWVSDYGWGVQKSSMHASSGDYALYSRKDRSYKFADTTTTTFFSSFNLSSLETAYISFSTKYEFYEGDVGYVEVSVDNGQTWEQIGEPFTGNQSEHELSEIPLDSYVKSDIEEFTMRFKIINNPKNSFPKWYIDDVILHPNEESSTAVKSEPHYIEPDYFVLNKNYPNPFNQSTVITYSMSHQQHLTIKILNILGQEVATLLDKQQMPGEYSITWNGRDHSGHEVNSGVYYCRIQTVNKTLTRKMLLLK